MELITRRGAQQLDAAAFAKRRAQYSSTLVDLGTGDGAWPRRFARQYDNCLAVGVDADRAALREAAKLAERKPARGGAPNTLFVVANAESLPSELQGAADWITIYFPWSALLRLILSGDRQLTTILDTLAASRARLSIVLNADAPPDGCAPPTPQSLRRSLTDPLSEAGFRIARADWLNAEDTPPTTWAGRLVKGSGRAMLAVSGQR